MERKEFSLMDHKYQCSKKINSTLLLMRTIHTIDKTIFIFKLMKELEKSYMLKTHKINF